MSNESRAKFEEIMRMLGFIDMHFTRNGDGYTNQYVNYSWQAYQSAHASRQSEIDSLRAENERLKAALSRICDKDFMYNEFQGAQTRIEMKLREIADSAISNERGK